jgi:hypothetical protein
MDGCVSFPQGKSGGPDAPLTKKLWLILFALILLCSSFSSNLIKAQYAYNYTFHGPYYDDGTVPNNGLAVVTLIYANSSSYTFNLQSSGTTPVTVTLSSSNSIQQATWNSTTSNITRIYTFLGTVSDVEVYIHIANPAQAAYEYTFSIADFYGMTNPYLEATVGAETRLIVERQSLNTTGIATFLMTQYFPYQLTFRCDQGTYTQSFTPGATFTTNLQVLAGSFPSTVTNDSLATATRTNATTIDVTYYDPDSATDWLYMKITHQDGAYLVTDYTDNQSSTNSLSTTVTVDNATDYFVQVQAYRYGGVMEWDFACPNLTLTNPFDGLLDYLGTWPTGFDPAQIFAAAIIMCALGLGSFRSAGVSCILAWILAGIFLAIGWFTISLPMLALAGVLSVLIVLTESKETTRDV